MSIKHLAELRNLKGLSQKELADLLGYTQRGISNWESTGNEPNYDTLCKLSKIFDVSVDYLVGNVAEGEETAGIPALPPREQILLAEYRKLTDEQKDFLLETIKHIKRK